MPAIPAAGDAADQFSLGDPASGTLGRSPPGPHQQRALYLRLPPDVTLCITIGRGSSGRADRAAGLGPD